MQSIYLQQGFDPEKLTTLKDEFSLYSFQTQCQKQEWSQVAIMYGNQLSEEELSLATRLRWIHSHNTNIDHLPIESIVKKENLFLTFTTEENVHQIGEYVLGIILAYAKQFFLWKQVSHEPEEFLQWPLMETMWTLKGRTFTQVGLGDIGTQIVKQASDFGMRTWGVRRHLSFHPFCQKTFGLQSLHSLLPYSDVVCVAWPLTLKKEILFSKSEFDLMKADSIFILVGNAEAIDEHALAKAAEKGKFRGVVLDGFQKGQLPENYPLWGIPSGIITPMISTFPESEKKGAFRQFRQNLRLFERGRVSEMINLIR
jgi:D-2-hydroxyacid dehydrogenase (NADP+)